jgi:hypothetical protein
LLGQLQVRSTAQGQLAALDKVDIYRTTCGDDPLTGKHAIPLDQRATESVLSHRENFTHYLPDGSDQLSHLILRIACRRGEAVLPLANNGVLLLLAVDK